MKRGLGVAGLLLLASVACGADNHTLTGTIHVVEQLGLTKANAIGENCTGTGGYDDLHAGTAVVVKDENSKVVATGQLGQGKITHLETCEWPFSVSGVPSATFYAVEVSHRGAVTLSRADLDGQHWSITLSVG